MTDSYIPKTHLPKRTIPLRKPNHDLVGTMENRMKAITSGRTQTKKPNKSAAPRERPEFTTLCAEVPCRKKVILFGNRCHEHACYSFSVMYGPCFKEKAHAGTHQNDKGETWGVNDK